MTGHQDRILGECYFCGENNGEWCKICRSVFCEDDHAKHEEIMKESDYLSYHQYYEMEIPGVKF